MQLGAYLDDITKGTIDLRERIARSKYIPEEELTRLDAIKQDTKSIITKNRRDWRNSLMLKEYRTVSEIAGPLMVVENVKASNLTNLSKCEWTVARFVRAGFRSQR